MARSFGQAFVLAEKNDFKGGVCSTAATNALQSFAIRSIRTDRVQMVQSLVTVRPVDVARKALYLRMSDRPFHAPDLPKKMEKHSFLDSFTYLLGSCH